MVTRYLHFVLNAIILAMAFHGTFAHCLFLPDELAVEISIRSELDANLYNGDTHIEYGSQMNELPKLVTEGNITVVVRMTDPTYGMYGAGGLVTYDVDLDDTVQRIGIAFMNPYGRAFYSSWFGLFIHDPIDKSKTMADLYNEMYYADEWFRPTKEKRLAYATDKKEASVQSERIRVTATMTDSRRSLLEVKLTQLK